MTPIGHFTHRSAPITEAGGKLAAERNTLDTPFPGEARHEGSPRGPAYPGQGAFGSRSCHLMPGLRTGLRCHQDADAARRPGTTRCAA